MKVFVATGGRTALAPNGTLWTNAPGSMYDKWKRYLMVFEEVILLVRAKSVDKPPPNWFPMNSDGISVYPLPYFEGPFKFFVNWPLISNRIRRALAMPHAVILRAPHHVSDAVFFALDKNRPFGAEIVGDPETALTNDNVGKFVGSLARPFSIRRLKYLCRRASVISYVTERTLQKRYPPSLNAFSTHYSTIELSDKQIVSSPRIPEGPFFKLVHVGSMTTYYKGQDILLKACKILLNKGLQLELSLAGDGPVRAEFEKLSNDLGISKNVKFLGQLAGPDKVRNVLLKSDLFVFPSRSEGLPRALIEAMSVGLPCVASIAGGIPEILPPEDTIMDIEPALLAEKIEEVLLDRQKIEIMSMRNIETAKKFSTRRLDEKRKKFYSLVKAKTEFWEKRRNKKLF